MQDTTSAAYAVPTHSEVGSPDLLQSAILLLREEAVRKIFASSMGAPEGSSLTTAVEKPVNFAATDIDCKGFKFSSLCNVLLTQAFREAVATHQVEGCLR